MRPVIFSFPTQTANSVCATQTTTATSQTLVLNGSLSNFNAGVTPFAVIVAPGIQRTITVTSTGDISTATFTLTGIDTSGYAVSTTLTGPNNGTATTVAEFFKVTAMSVGTIATSAFTVGVGATGTSRWAMVDTFQNPVAVSIAINTVTSAPVSIQHTFDPISTATSPTVIAATGLTGVTTSTNLNYFENATAYRAIFIATGTATGAAQVNFVQSGY